MDSQNESGSDGEELFAQSPGALTADVSGQVLELCESDYGDIPCADILASQLALDEMADPLAFFSPPRNVVTTHHDFPSIKTGSPFVKDHHRPETGPCASGKNRKNHSEVVLEAASPGKGSPNLQNFSPWKRVSSEEDVRAKPSGLVHNSFASNSSFDLEKEKRNFDVGGVCSTEFVSSYHNLDRELVKSRTCDVLDPSTASMGANSCDKKIEEPRQPARTSPERATDTHNSNCASDKHSCEDKNPFHLADYCTVGASVLPFVGGSTSQTCLNSDRSERERSLMESIIGRNISSSDIGCVAGEQDKKWKNIDNLPENNCINSKYVSSNESRNEHKKDVISSANEVTIKATEEKSSSLLESYFKAEKKAEGLYDSRVHQLASVFSKINESKLPKKSVLVQSSSTKVESNLEWNTESELMHKKTKNLIHTPASGSKPSVVSVSRSAEVNPRLESLDNIHNSKPVNKSRLDGATAPCMASSGSSATPCAGELVDQTCGLTQREANQEYLLPTSQTTSLGEPSGLLASESAQPSGSSLTFGRAGTSCMTPTEQRSPIPTCSAPGDGSAVLAAESQLSCSNPPSTTSMSDDSCFVESIEKCSASSKSELVKLTVIPNSSLTTKFPSSLRFEGGRCFLSSSHQYRVSQAVSSKKKYIFYTNATAVGGKSKVALESDPYYLDKSSFADLLIDSPSDPSDCDVTVIDGEDPLAIDNSLTPLLADDGPLLADDGPLLTDDGPLFADDGPLLADDGPLLADDGPLLADDGPLLVDGRPPADCGREIDNSAFAGKAASGLTDLDNLLVDEDLPLAIDERPSFREENLPREDKLVKKDKSEVNIANKSLSVSSAGKKKSAKIKSSNIEAKKNGWTERKDSKRNPIVKLFPKDSDRGFGLSLGLSPSSRLFHTIEMLKSKPCASSLNQNMSLKQDYNYVKSREPFSSSQVNHSRSSHPRKSVEDVSSSAAGCVQDRAGWDAPHSQISCKFQVCLVAENGKIVAKNVPVSLPRKLPAQPEAARSKKENTAPASKDDADVIVLEPSGFRPKSPRSGGSEETTENSHDFSVQSNNNYGQAIPVIRIPSPDAPELIPISGVGATALESLPLLSIPDPSSLPSLNLSSSEVDGAVPVISIPCSSSLTSINFSSTEGEELLSALEMTNGNLNLLPAVSCSSSLESRMVLSAGAPSTPVALVPSVAMSNKEPGTSAARELQSFESVDSSSIPVLSLSENFCGQSNLDALPLLDLLESGTIVSEAEPAFSSASGMITSTVSTTSSTGCITTAVQIASKEVVPSSSTQNVLPKFAIKSASPRKRKKEKPLHSPTDVSGQKTKSSTNKSVKMTPSICAIDAGSHLTPGTIIPSISLENNTPRQNRREAVVASQKTNALSSDSNANSCMSLGSIGQRFDSDLSSAVATSVNSLSRKEFFELSRSGYVDFFDRKLMSEYHTAYSSGKTMPSILKRRRFPDDGSVSSSLPGRGSGSTTKGRNVSGNLRRRKLKLMTLNPHLSAKSEGVLEKLERDKVLAMKGAKKTPPSEAPKEVLPCMYGSAEDSLHQAEIGEEDANKSQLQLQITGVSSLSENALEAEPPFKVLGPLKVNIENVKKEFPQESMEADCYNSAIDGSMLKLPLLKVKLEKPAQDHEGSDQSSSIDSGFLSVPSPDDLCGGALVCGSRPVSCVAGFQLSASVGDASKKDIGEPSTRAQSALLSPSQIKIEHADDSFDAVEAAHDFSPPLDVSSSLCVDVKVPQESWGLASSSTPLDVDLPMPHTGEAKVRTNISERPPTLLQDGSSKKSDSISVSISSVVPSLNTGAPEPNFSSLLSTSTTSHVGAGPFIGPPAETEEHHHDQQLSWVVGGRSTSRKKRSMLGPSQVRILSSSDFKNKVKKNPETLRPPKTSCLSIARPNTPPNLSGSARNDALPLSLEKRRAVVRLTRLPRDVLARHQRGEMITVPFSLPETWTVPATTLALRCDSEAKGKTGIACRGASKVKAKTACQRSHSRERDGSVNDQAFTPRWSKTVRSRESSPKLTKFDSMSGNPLNDDVVPSRARNVLRIVSSDSDSDGSDFKRSQAECRLKKLTLCRKRKLPPRRAVGSQSYAEPGSDHELLDGDSEFYVQLSEKSLSAAANEDEQNVSIKKRKQEEAADGGQSCNIKVRNHFETDIRACDHSTSTSSFENFKKGNPTPRLVSAGMEKKDNLSTSSSCHPSTDGQTSAGSESLQISWPGTDEPTTKCVASPRSSNQYVVATESHQNSFKMTFRRSSHDGASVYSKSVDSLSRVGLGKGSMDLEVVSHSDRSSSPHLPVAGSKPTDSNKAFIKSLHPVAFAEELVSLEDAIRSLASSPGLGSEHDRNSPPSLRLSDDVLSRESNTNEVHPPEEFPTFSVEFGKQFSGDQTCTSKFSDATESSIQKGDLHERSSKEGDLHKRSSKKGDLHKRNSKERDAFREAPVSGDGSRSDRADHKTSTAGGASSRQTPSDVAAPASDVEVLGCGADFFSGDDVSDDENIGQTIDKLADSIMCSAEGTPVGTCPVGREEESLRSSANANAKLGFPSSQEKNVSGNSNVLTSGSAGSGILTPVPPESHSSVNESLLAERMPASETCGNETIGARWSHAPSGGPPSDAPTDGENHPDTHVSHSSSQLSSGAEVRDESVQDSGSILTADELCRVRDIPSGEGPLPSGGGTLPSGGGTLPSGGGTSPSGSGADTSLTSVDMNCHAPAASTVAVPARTPPLHQAVGALTSDLRTASHWPSTTLAAIPLTTTVYVLPSKVLLPSTAASVPSTVASVPSTVASVPSTVASVSSTVASVPSIVASVPSIVASFPSIVASFPSIIALVPSIVASVPSTAASVLSTVASVPSIVASVPSTVASVPSTVASVPSIVASVPSTAASVPSTVASVPSSVASVPSTAASVPSTAASVPPTAASVPSTAASVPSTAASVPSTAASVPSTAASVPSTAASVPSTAASVPSTAASVLSTAASVLSNAASVPSTAASVPSTAASVPSTAASVPSTVASVPSTAASVPSTAASVPSTAASVPSTAASVPSTAASVSSTAASVSSTAASVLSTAASVPSTAASVLSTAASVLSNAASVPSTAASVPSTAASVPSTAASVPSTAASVPSTAASVPSTAASVPSTAASVPSTADSVSSTAASVPSTAASVPSTAASVSSTAVSVETIVVSASCVDHTALTFCTLSPSTPSLSPATPTWAAPTYNSTLIHTLAPSSITHPTSPSTAHSTPPSAMSTTTAHPTRNSTSPSPNSTFPSPNSTFPSPNSTSPTPSSTFTSPSLNCTSPTPSINCISPMPNCTSRSPNSSSCSPNSTSRSPNSTSRSPNSTSRSPNSTSLSPHSTSSTPSPKTISPSSSSTFPTPFSAPSFGLGAAGSPKSTLEAAGKSHTMTTGRGAAGSPHSSDNWRTVDQGTSARHEGLPSSSRGPVTELGAPLVASIKREGISLDYSDPGACEGESDSHCPAAQAFEGVISRIVKQELGDEDPFCEGRAVGGCDEGQSVTAAHLPQQPTALLPPQPAALLPHPPAFLQQPEHLLQQPVNLLQLPDSFLQQPDALLQQIAALLQQPTPFLAQPVAHPLQQSAACTAKGSVQIKQELVMEQPDHSEICKPDPCLTLSPSLAWVPGASRPALAQLGTGSPAAPYGVLTHLSVDQALPGAPETDSVEQLEAEKSPRPDDESLAKSSSSSLLGSFLGQNTALLGPPRPKHGSSPGPELIGRSAEGSDVKRPLGPLARNMCTSGVGQSGTPLALDALSKLAEPAVVRHLQEFKPVVRLSKLPEPMVSQLKWSKPASQLQVSEGHECELSQPLAGQPFGATQRRDELKPPLVGPFLSSSPAGCTKVSAVADDAAVSGKPELFPEYDSPNAVRKPLLNGLGFSKQGEFVDVNAVVKKEKTRCEISTDGSIANVAPAADTKSMKKMIICADEEGASLSERSLGQDVKVAIPEATHPCKTSPNFMKDCETDSKRADYNKGTRQKKPELEAKAKKSLSVFQRNKSVLQNHHEHKLGFQLLQDDHLVPLPGDVPLVYAPEAAGRSASCSKNKAPKSLVDVPSSSRRKRKLSSSLKCPSSAKKKSPFSALSSSMQVGLTSPRTTSHRALEVSPTKKVTEVKKITSEESLPKSPALCVTSDLVGLNCNSSQDLRPSSPLRTCSPSPDNACGAGTSHSFFDVKNSLEMGPSPAPSADCAISGEFLRSPPHTASLAAPHPPSCTSPIKSESLCLIEGSPFMGLTPAGSSGAALLSHLPSFESEPSHVSEDLLPFAEDDYELPEDFNPFDLEFTPSDPSKDRSGGLLDHENEKNLDEDSASGLQGMTSKVGLRDPHLSKLKCSREAWPEGEGSRPAQLSDDSAGSGEESDHMEDPSYNIFNQLCCPKCDYKTRSSTSYQHHTLTYHSSQPSTTKRRKSRLVVRRRRWSRRGKRRALPTEGRLFSCRRCEFETENVSQFQRHKMTHSDRFSCKYCQFETSDCEAFAVHLKTHTEKKYYCNLCSFATLNARYFEVHRSAHNLHPSRPASKRGSRGRPRIAVKLLRKYKCALCNYITLSHSSYNFHCARSHPSSGAAQV